MGTMRRIWRRLTFAVAREKKLRQARWEEFKKANAGAIATLPVKNGRKAVPAIWNPRAKEWQWMTRPQRRNALRQVKRRQKR